MIEKIRFIADQKRQNNIDLENSQIAIMENLILKHLPEFEEAMLKCQKIKSLTLRENLELRFYYLCSMVNNICNNDKSIVERFTKANMDLIRDRRYKDKWTHEREI